jgi:hypothetical protein
VPRTVRGLLALISAAVVWLALGERVVAAEDGRLGNGYGAVAWGQGVPLDAELERVAVAGLDWIELPLRWAWLQPNNDTELRWTEAGYDLIVQGARTRNVKLLFRLIDPPRWAGGKPALAKPDQVAQVLVKVDQQMAGVAHAFQVFNEPNLPLEWGGPPDPPLLVRQLSASSAGLRAAHSSAALLSPAMAPATGRGGGSFEDVDYLTAAYRAGLKGTVDAVGAQAYGGNFAPTADPWHCSPLCFRRVELYRAVMHTFADSDTKLWATEMGWLAASERSLPGFDWMKVGPDDQASYLAGALQYARQRWPWLGGMFVFNLDFALALPASQQMSWFSLFDQTNQPRAAYRALAQVAKVPPPSAAELAEVAPPPKADVVVTPSAVPPHFAFGFAALKAELGATMGDPVDVEQQASDTGDALQQTTTGLVVYRAGTNTPIFTDGYRHWALTARGLVSWTGASVDPPPAVVENPPPAGPNQATDDLRT